MRKARWYFDFISPFAYPQLARVGDMLTDLDFGLKRMLFAELLKRWN
ncbi:MAG: hypothetical protein AAGB04_23220 [Pseudomonadota bacterium]